MLIAGSLVFCAQMGHRGYRTITVSCRPSETPRPEDPRQGLPGSPEAYRQARLRSTLRRAMLRSRGTSEDRKLAPDFLISSLCEASIVFSLVRHPAWAASPLGLKFRERHVFVGAAILTAQFYRSHAGRNRRVLAYGEKLKVPLYLMDGSMNDDLDDLQTEEPCAVHFDEKLQDP
jgi:hypothetical protein